MPDPLHFWKRNSGTFTAGIAVPPPSAASIRHVVVMDAHSILNKYTFVAPDLLRCLD